MYFNKRNKNENEMMAMQMQKKNLQRQKGSLCPRRALMSADKFAHPT